MNDLAKWNSRSPRARMQTLKGWGRATADSFRLGHSAENARAIAAKEEYESELRWEWGVAYSKGGLFEEREGTSLLFEAWRTAYIEKEATQ